VTRSRSDSFFVHSKAVNEEANEEEAKEEEEAAKE
jgi:hypothetical protein